MGIIIINETRAERNCLKMIAFHGKICLFMVILIATSALQKFLLLGYVYHRKVFSLHFSKVLNTGGNIVKTIPVHTDP